MKDLRQQLLSSSIPALADHLKQLSKASRHANQETRAKIVSDIRSLAKELDKVTAHNSQENIYRSKLKQACMQEIDKISSLKPEQEPTQMVSVKSYEEEQELSFQSEIFQERNKEIKEIELQLSSVKDLMHETASTVYTQGYALDRLDTYVDQTATTTQRAVKELEQAASLQRRASGFSCTSWLLWALFFTGALVLVRYLLTQKL